MTLNYKGKLCHHLPEMKLAAKVEVSFFVQNDSELHLKIVTGICPEIL